MAIRIEKSVFPVLIFTSAIAFEFLLLSNLHIAIIFAWLSAWTVVLTLFLCKFLKKQELKQLFPYIFLGLTIRLTIAILFRIKNVSTGGLITPDEYFYFNYSKDIAEAWKSGQLLGLTDIWHYVETKNFGYHIWCALHFLILPEKLLPVISNIFLDVVTSVLIFKFVSKFFGSKISKLAFFLYLFNPFTIYWSTFLLKDTLLTFLLMLLFYLSNNFFLYKKTVQGVLLLPILMSITLLRFYLSFIVIFIMMIWFLFGSRNKIKALLLIGTLIILFIFYSPLKNIMLTELPEEGLRQIFSFYMNRSLLIAQSREQYSTRFITDYDIKSLLISFAHFLLSPSPFNLQGDGKYLVWGTLFWYFLFPFYVIGTFLFIKHSLMRYKYIFIWLFPLLIIMTIALMPAINEPRHRLMIMPFATIIASLGLKYKIAHKKEIVFFIWILIVLTVVTRESLMGGFK